MANPQNPLDVFVTYTCHFELHGAKTWEELRAIQDIDVNATTTATRSNGTLLINTRKDAHQTIDHVRFRYANPTLDPTGIMSPIIDLNLTIIEPNGTSFIEKLQKRAKDLDILDITSSLIFGLKIFFVGRLKNGTIKTIPFSRIIPLQLYHMEAKYNYGGGDYQLAFQQSSTAAVTTSKPMKTGLQKAISYSNKNITIKARTVTEAISQLEKKLNDNYDNIYSTELENSTGARKITYKINLDPDITGKIYAITKDGTYNDSAERLIVLDQGKQIIDMIRQILHSSKEVNEMISASKDGLKQQFHPNVKFPVFSARYELKENEAVITYDIMLYKGGSGGDFEFDFYFAQPGKNVDILDFEIVFPNMLAWVSGSMHSVPLYTNTDSTVAASQPGSYSANTVHEDTTRTKLKNIPQQKKSIPAASGDVAHLPSTTRTEQSGYVSVQHQVVPAMRLAFETLTEACSAREPQQTFTIRGHFDLLANCVPYPDGTVLGFGMIDGIWIKVNIYNPDGKTPFYYTGFYRLLHIDNVFSGGKFTQLLTTIMIPRNNL